MPIPFSILRCFDFRFYAGNTADDCISILRNHKKLQESSKKGIRKPARERGKTGRVEEGKKKKSAMKGYLAVSLDLLFGITQNLSSG